MPEPKRPLKVFLCHARADRDAVRALYTRLKNDDVDMKIFVPDSFLKNE